jgi:branched-chain amino acid transport system ATP-binding protein
MTLLQTQCLTKHFGGLCAVDAVTLAVEEGQIFSIIGPNGAGKTTLFNCLTGFYPPSSGQITFAGKDISRLRSHQISRRGIARTFQNVRLFGEMSALENVMVGFYSHTRTGVLRSMLQTPFARREDRRTAEQALELLRSVGLANHSDTWARNLAYGDQRRLEIARALATQPKLLLLDEPAAGMNPQEIVAIMELIRRVRDQGKTVILIEHHMQVVMGISDRIAVLDYGEKIAEGTPDEVRNNPDVIKAYLGEEERTP